MGIFVERKDTFDMIKAIACIAIGRLIVHVGERLHCNRALWFELSVFPLVLTGSVLIAIVAREISKRSCS